MLFNSLRFLLFFPIVVFLYYSIPHRFRWILLLIASYFFYACWKAEYSILLFIATIINYVAGIQMAKIDIRARRRFWMILSLVSTIGILFLFKYFNFVSESIKYALGNLNPFKGFPALKVLLPVGISFYSLQALNYTIDVYRRKREPERHLGIFALYVAFFPQLLSGPISRSISLIPQLYQRHDFDYNRLVNGLQLMLWGFFKKIVIADRLSILVNKVYDSPSQYDGIAFIIATYFFAFQIYCDFSGYSDIAIGCAEVMGIELMQNFRNPYHSKSINEFWKRWHISLTSWFRDYVWMVLKWPWYYSIMFVFLLSGLWHGANWTYLIWGALNGFYLLFAIWSSELRNEISRQLKITSFPRLRRAFKVLATFHLIWFGWIFFRANSISDALYIIRHLFSNVGNLLLNITHLSVVSRMIFSQDIGLSIHEFILAVLTVIAMEAIHLVQTKHSIRELINSRPLWIRWVFLYVALLAIFLLGEFHANRFIYFQF
jgi:alginate O-acetyltransferase complex protein AlgI